MRISDSQRNVCKSSILSSGNRPSSPGLKKLPQDNDQKRNSNAAHLWEPKESSLNGYGSTDGCGYDALCREHARARASFHHAHEHGCVFLRYDSTFRFTSDFSFTIQFQLKGYKSFTVIDQFRIWKKFPNEYFIISCIFSFFNKNNSYIEFLGSN